MSHHYEFTEGIKVVQKVFCSLVFFLVQYLFLFICFDLFSFCRLKEAIEIALQLSPKHNVLDGFSQNHRIRSPLGSVQSNIIFDESNMMPKEMMVEARLKAFDLNYDIFEV